jgi:hypothetical protein
MNVRWIQIAWGIAKGASQRPRNLKSWNESLFFATNNVVVSIDYALPGGSGSLVTSLQSLR